MTLVDHGMSATLPIPDSLGILTVCLGKTKDSTVACYILLQRRDNTVQMSTLYVGTAFPDTLSGTDNAELIPGRTLGFPLDLRVLPSRNKLFFRWSLSPAMDTLPGGVPTPRNSPIEMGKILPRIQVKGLTGNCISTNDFRGKPVVVNWWAIWCSGCTLEMPGLDSLVDMYNGRVSFLAICQDSAQQLIAFLKNHKFSFIQTVSSDSTERMLGDTFPRTLILDSKGKIVQDILGGGVNTYKDIEQTLDRIINK